jgi:hypothetical protein
MAEQTGERERERERERGQRQDMLFNVISKQPTSSDQCPAPPNGPFNYNPLMD